MLRAYEPDHIRQPRKGLGIPVRHPQPAAREQVVARELPVLGDHDEPDIIREHVDVVQRRDGKRDLELPRQVAVAVQRIHKARAASLLKIQFLPFNPNRVVGRRFGRQRSARVFRASASTCSTSGLVDGRRRSHHVARHVAACRNRRHQRLVQRFDRSAADSI